jgi:hypothetical protein
MQRAQKPDLCTEELSQVTSVANIPPLPLAQSRQRTPTVFNFLILFNFILLRCLHCTCKFDRGEYIPQTFAYIHISHNSEMRFRFCGFICFKTELIGSSTEAEGLNPARCIDLCQRFDVELRISQC